MIKRCPQYPQIIGIFIAAGLGETLAFQKHAGSLAELHYGTGHTFRPEGKMRCGIKCNLRKRTHMANSMHAFWPGILASHDIAQEINRNLILPIHAAFLPQGGDGPALN